MRQASARRSLNALTEDSHVIDRHVLAQSW
jgi:hypothetical protein